MIKYLFLILAFSSNAYSKEYLIKLNSNYKNEIDLVLQSFGEVSEIPVRFANFKKIKTKKPTCFGKFSFLIIEKLSFIEKPSINVIFPSVSCISTIPFGEYLV